MENSVNRFLKFVNETQNKPYFSTLYDIDMWKEDKEAIIRALEMLELIKKHYRMNGFNELLPIYFDYETGDRIDFKQIEEYLENGIYINKTKMRDILAEIKGKETFKEMREKLGWNHTAMSLIVQEKRIMNPKQYKDIKRIYNPSVELSNKLIYKILVQVDEKTREKYLS